MTGDKFERLVRLHKDAVYRQMARVCAHREDAEDALASALLLAFQSADQLGSDEAFRSWLSTIGKRVCTRMRSHPSIQNVLDLAIEKNLVKPGTDEFDLQMLKGCVLEALAELPPAYKSVYEACELEELTVPEAASRLGISVAATKSRLFRARALVRDRLDHSICGV